MRVIVYTDASYNDIYDIAACGYVVIINGEVVMHRVRILTNIGCSGNAEVYAAADGSQYAFLIPGVTEIRIRTDYHSLTQKRRGGRRRNLIWTELLETIEMIRESKIKFGLDYVKGHNGNKYNTIIDESCRTELRKHIGDQYGTKGVKPPNRVTMPGEYEAAHRGRS